MRHIPRASRFPRVDAPVVYQPAPFFGPKRPIATASLDGVRVFSDEPFKVGQRLDLEMFPSRDSSVRCMVKVDRVDSLDEARPARFEVWLRLLQAKPGGLAYLDQLSSAS